MWEEPPISGSCGSGTVFFAGCNLRCSFCQNRVISHERRGTAITEEDLMRRILALADTGVHNINLVTPTHYTDALTRLLEKVKARLPIPVVWNSSGYESPEALARLKGLVDIYLPDFKYVSPEVSMALSLAPDYGAVATAAVQTMFAQTGPVLFDEAGMMRRGVLIRHLVLPGYRQESIAVLEHLAAILPLPDIRISIMSQYTPEFAADCSQKSLHRRLTDFEYRSVLDAADRLGVVGYRQGRASATRCYTPDFGEGNL
jgi:putative pyruvate formate lyase activating enzyme